MIEDKCSGGGETLLLACSGGSNVGQLANQACVELAQEGFGRMFCLAGVGGGLMGFVQAAREADQLVVIDGCEAGCAKAIFAQAELPLRGYLVLTHLGIAKNKDFALKREELDQVKQAVKLMASPLFRQGPAKGCCC